MRGFAASAPDDNELRIHSPMSSEFSNRTLPRREPWANHRLRGCLGLNSMTPAMRAEPSSKGYGKKV